MCDFEVEKLEGNKSNYILLEGNEDKIQMAIKKKAEMADALSLYDEQCRFYLQSPMDTCPLPEGATPDLQETLVRQRRRLQKLKLEVAFPQPAQAPEKSLTFKGKPVKGDIYEDGGQDVGCLEKKSKYYTEYYSGTDWIGCIKENIWQQFYIIKDFREAGLPSQECWKISSQVRSAGCQHTYGRFKEYIYANSIIGDVIVIGLKSYFLCFAIAPLSMVGMGCFYFLSASWEGGIRWFVKLLAFIVLSFCVLSITAISVHFHNMLGGFHNRRKSSKVVAAIRSQKADFCIERFAAMAENRLKCIYYGDTMADIGAFVSNDFSAFLEKHKDVVNCDVVNFWFHKFWQDEENQYIEVCQRVVLTKVMGNRIKRKKKNVKMRFMRPINSIMSTDFYHDWYVTEVKI